MKDLTGMEYRQARVLLTDLGMNLKIESREESSDKYGDRKSVGRERVC